MTRSKPISRQSPRKRREAREWAATKQQRAKMVGEWCEWPGCTQRWTDAHHVLKRRFFAAVVEMFRVMLCRLFCRKHHDYCETHPKESHALGFSMTLAEAIERGFVDEDSLGGQS